MPQDSIFYILGDSYRLGYVYIYIYIYTCIYIYIYMCIYIYIILYYIFYIMAVLMPKDYILQPGNDFAAGNVPGVE